MCLNKALERLPRVSHRPAAESIRHTAKALKKECRITVDLEGPKIRVGPMAVVPGMVKARPARTPHGASFAAGEARARSNTALQAL